MKRIGLSADLKFLCCYGIFLKIVYELTLRTWKWNTDLMKYLLVKWDDQFTWVQTNDKREILTGRVWSSWCPCQRRAAPCRTADSRLTSSSVLTCVTSHGVCSVAVRWRLSLSVLLPTDPSRLSGDPHRPRHCHNLLPSSNTRTASRHCSQSDQCPALNTIIM